MTYDYVQVDGDDWNGIFLNGKLLTEAHDFRIREVFEIILAAGGKVDSFVRKEVDGQWLYEHGSFPKDLSEVKLL